MSNSSLPISVFYNNHAYTKLERFKTLHDNGPRQRTEEWYRRRQATIGGSEMADITLENAYCTPKASIVKLLRNKAGCGSNFSNIAMKWGVIFEPTIRSYIEWMYSTTIEEMGSIRGVHRTSCSVDGIGVVRLTSGVPIVSVFEFKCPLSRKLDGNVPTHYAPQLRLTMNNIYIASSIIYAEASFRKFSILHDEHLDEAAYDREFHRGDTKNKIAFSEPQSIGIIGFRTQNADDAMRWKSMWGKFFPIDTERNLIDFGRGDLAKISWAFEHLDFWYGDIAEWRNPQLDPVEFLDDEIAAFSAECGDCALGYLPWKLFAIDIHEWLRTAEMSKYLAQYSPRIQHVLGHVEKILSLPMEDRMREIDACAPAIAREIATL